MLELFLGVLFMIWLSYIIFSDNFGDMYLGGRWSTTPR